MRPRTAGPGDAAAIAAIWNPVIRDTPATFTSEEKTTSDMEELIARRRAENHAFLVVDSAEGLAGFATYAPFRHGPGYAHTMEQTVMLAPEARREGIGLGLAAALEAHAVQRGVHTLWAGISAENRQAVAFHARLGFQHIARLPEVGFKFGRWMDLILMLKKL